MVVAATPIPTDAPVLSPAGPEVDVVVVDILEDPVVVDKDVLLLILFVSVEEDARLKVTPAFSRASTGAEAGVNSGRSDSAHATDIAGP
jgi:hypothetical protein